MITGGRRDCESLAAAVVNAGCAWSYCAVRVLGDGECENGLIDCNRSKSRNSAAGSGDRVVECTRFGAGSKQPCSIDAARVSIYNSPNWRALNFVIAAISTGSGKLLCCHDIDSWIIGIDCDYRQGAGIDSKSVGRSGFT